MPGPRTVGERMRGAGPVPSRIRARSLRGRCRTGLSRPDSNSCMVPTRATTRVAPTPSRFEFMHGPRTGDDKRRPYESRAELRPEPGAGVVGDGLVPSRFEFMHGPSTGDDKRRPYTVPIRIHAWSQDGRRQASPLRIPCRITPGARRGRCRGRACPVPIRIHAWSQHGRRQASPLHRPDSNSCMVPTRATTSVAPTPSRFEFMHGPDTGDDKRRPYTVPIRIHAWSRHGRRQASPLHRPDSNSCMVPTRATTRGRPYTSRFEFMHGPKTGDDKRRPYTVPIRIHAWSRRGRRQASPLRIPCRITPGARRGRCRGRACPVPIRIHAWSRHGRRQASPLHRPDSNSCMVPRRATTRVAPTPSRFEFMHGPRTGDDKRRPYESRAELRPEPGAGVVGDGLVPSRFEFMHGSQHGRRQASPLHRPDSNSCMVPTRATTSVAPTPSRFEFMHGPDTGDDKRRPDTSRCQGHATSEAPASGRRQSVR